MQLLANGKQQFLDANGAPLAGGLVYHYAPGTTNPVSTYRDSAGQSANTNPIQLDSRGQAVIWGIGTFRQVVTDSTGALLWDQVVNAPDVNAAASGLESALTAPDGAALIGFTPPGPGALPTTVQAALEVFGQKPTGRVFANEGARVNRINDRLFVGKVATTYDGNGPAVAGSWVGQPSGGIYQYLETNAIFGAYAQGSSIGMFAAGRSSETSGTSGEVSIGVASFVHQDHVGGASGVWNFYGTALRQAGTNGPTHGIELDIANMGNTAVADPYVVNPAGLTNGMRICTGGETTGAGTASYALGIIQNDGAATPTAKFEKGMVFHAAAIAGTDGVTGTGTAIAMAKGHTINWYNAGHHLTSYVYSAVGNEAAGQGIIFTDAGTNIVSVADGSLLFQVAATSGAANAIQVQAAAAGQAPELTVAGSDANIDFKIGGKGSGVVHLVQSTVTTAGAAGARTLYGYVDIKVNGVTFKMPIYS